MRPRRALPVAMGVYASLLGCAISIDHSLVKDGGSGDLLACTPSSVQGCSSDGKSLVKCRASGSGTYNLSCGQHQCSAALQRCDGCDPAQPATCSGSNRLACSADGLPEETVCPIGCKGGSCCEDGDGDKYSSCAGDCNDADANVHPGQSTYYSVPARGSFDYDCNGRDERQYPDLASCHTVSGGKCVGGGWQGSVPACGQQGTFVDCRKQGPSCTAQTPRPSTQSCR